MLYESDLSRANNRIGLLRHALRKIAEMADDYEGEGWAYRIASDALFSDEKTTPDRSGEADETRSGSAEGEGGLPEGSSKP